MGHKARVPYPSPLQMLAILNARSRGLSAHTIHRRTGYGNMSVLRWFANWSADSKVFDDWVREYRIDLGEYEFDRMYPPPQMAIPKPTQSSGEKVQRATFLTLDGYK